MWRTSEQSSTSPTLEECFGCCRRIRRRRIHPLSTEKSPHVEMVQLDARTVLRVVRVLPEEKQKENELQDQIVLIDQIPVAADKIFRVELHNFAEIIVNTSIKEALIQMCCDKCYCNGVEGFINPSFIASCTELSLICENNVNESVVSHHSVNSSMESISRCDSSTLSSTWGSNTGESLRFRRLYPPPKSSANPLIFFVHGVGSSADIWKMQMKYFSNKGYETVAVDLIGHGFSSAPYDSKSYTFRRILSDVTNIFDRFCHETNVLVGHSYGSSFAAALANHRSSQVSHLVLISGGGPVSLRPKNDESAFRCVLACLQPLFTCGLYRDLFYTPTGRQIVCGNPYEVPSRVIKYMEKGQKWKEGDASFYRRISTPTLLIYGLRDPLVTLVEECEMEKAIPRSVLELVPGASHMVMLEEPGRVNRVLHSFIKHT